MAIRINEYQIHLKIAAHEEIFEQDLNSFEQLLLIGFLFDDVSLRTINFKDKHILSEFGKT